MELKFKVAFWRRSAWSDSTYSVIVEDLATEIPAIVEWTSKGKDHEVIITGREEKSA